ncbi:SRPBCC domain-containing protein [Tropicimonas marinistellae]|uniref:SRPBCC domain-containing protein n=1 Tax=Tropicimonas marinistellae TaxID=1739787 RepID=UPI0008320799|nr:SRPBCC domain-containing protein [Tropicimonas marinistellae]
MLAGTTESFARLSIDTAIDIPAPAEVVWDVLADIEAYPEWNPYHVRVDGVLEIGEKLAVHVVKPNGTALTVHPHLMEFDRGKSLVWGGGPAGIFRGVHRFDLETLSPACTRLRHTEIFSGLFIQFAELDAIEHGYVLMNRALRDRVAAVHGTGENC